MANIVIKYGGFSQISGLDFRDYMAENGKQLVKNLCEVQETLRPDKSGPLYIARTN